MSSTQGPDAPTGGSELIQPRSNDRLPRGIACDGGFKLLGTPLGFRGSTRPGLLFFSDLDDALPGTGQRVLATPFAAAAIGAARRDLDVLVLDYERTAKLGRMDIRLLSSGRGPGSALLEVSFRNRRILYCGSVRTASPLFGLPAEPTPCDLLLLDAAPSPHRGVAPRTASHRLETAVRNALSDGEIAYLSCSTRTAALEAAVVVSGIDTPFLAQRPIFEMLRRVERFGFAFLHLHRLERTLPKEGVVLCYDRVAPPFSGGSDGSRHIRVGPVAMNSSKAGAPIRLAEGEDRAGLVEFALKTGAANVALGPACDERIAASLEKSGVTVYRLQRPTQMPLFL